MDKIKKYQELIIDLLNEYAQTKPANLIDAEMELIADRDRNHFQLLTVGWSKKEEFVYVVNFHFDIKPTGKIWLMANNTDILIAQELVKRGVPRKDIVLGFQPPSVRPQTEYAVA